MGRWPMGSSAVPLYDVLVAEYESQGLQPPFPAAELAAAFAARRPEIEASLGPLAESDPDEHARRLDAERVKGFYAWLHRNRVRRSAVCVSGGGIRSATFGLGLVQGLASHRMLDRFDYLSTVSGGGYLGSWLSAWLHRERLRSGDAGKALAEVESQLSRLP